MESISSGLVASVQVWGHCSAFLPAESQTDQAHVIVLLALLVKNRVREDQEK